MFTRLTVIFALILSALCSRSNPSQLDMPLMGQLKHQLEHQMQDVDQDIRKIQIGDVHNHFQEMPANIHMHMQDNVPNLHHQLQEQLQHNLEHMQVDIPHTNGLQIRFNGGSNVLSNRVSEKSESGFRVLPLVIALATVTLSL